MSKATGLNGLRLTVQAIMQMLRKKADKDKVVRSVNGQTGDVTVDIPVLPDRIVESVNGVEPDAEGNVDVSWNDLQDRPFGEVSAPHEITWTLTDTELSVIVDGVTETTAIADAVVVVDTYYFLTDCVIANNAESFNTLMLHADGEKTSYAEQMYDYETLVSYGMVSADYIVMEGPIITYADGVTFNGMTFPKKGVYLPDAMFGVYDGISFTNTEIKQLDPKFIPSVGGGSMIITIDADDEGNLTANKTFEEIQEAIASGVFPVCVYGSYLFTLSKSSAIGATTYAVSRKHDFACVELSAGAIVLHLIFIDEAETVTYVKATTSATIEA